jgi:hypothetical protein
MKHKFERKPLGEQVMTIPFNCEITVTGVENYSYAKHIERRMDISDGDLELVEKILNLHVENMTEVLNCDQLQGTEIHSVNKNELENCERIIEKLRI